MPVRQAGLFGLVGHGRRAVRVPRAFADKDAAGGMVAVVACVDSNTYAFSTLTHGLPLCSIKVFGASAFPTTTCCGGDPMNRDMIQEREQSAELGRPGDLHLVRAEGYAAFRVPSVGDRGRFERVAKKLAVDIEFAESFGGGEVVTDESQKHTINEFNGLNKTAIKLPGN